MSNELERFGHKMMKGGCLLMLAGILAAIALAFLFFFAAVIAAAGA